jgi:hypothetical protein
MWRTNQVKILRDIRIIATCLILGTGLFACKSSATPQEPANTAVPVATNTVAPSATPLPTDTPTLEPTTTPLPTDTPTLEPTVTPDLTATAAIEATQAAEEAMAIVSKDLDVVGISATSGKLAWLSTESVTLKVTTYGERNYQFIDPDLVVQDFVFQTDVTWESTGGLAACGVIFRAEEDLDRGAYYEFLTIRLSGLPAWGVFRIDYNTIQDDLSPKSPYSSSINQKQGSTNTYTLIAKGNSFTFYTNGDRMGTVFNSKLPEGLIAYQASQESGETSCTFENTWLFVLNQP